MRGRAPGARRQNRIDNMQGAIQMLRQGVINQNRSVNRPARRAAGISSASVFQNVSGKPELKFVDVFSAIAPAAGATAGSLTGPLNPLAQGTDANQHIGRQVTMKSVYWMLQANMAAASTGSGSIRVVMVYDKESEGAAPTIATGAATDIFASDDDQAVMNLNNRDRFVVLSDEIIECIGTAGPQSAFRKGYRKVQLPMVFNAVTTATISAIQTGAIYVVCWQSGGIATAAPLVELRTRVRFEDA